MHPGGRFSEVVNVRIQDLAFKLSALPILGLGTLGCFLLGAWFLPPGAMTWWT